MMLFLLGCREILDGCTEFVPSLSKLTLPARESVRGVQPPLSCLLLRAERSLTPIPLPVTLCAISPLSFEGDDEEVVLGDLLGGEEEVLDEDTATLDKSFTPFPFPRGDDCGIRISLCNCVILFGSQLFFNTKFAEATPEFFLAVTFSSGFEFKLSGDGAFLLNAP